MQELIVSFHAMSSLSCYLAVLCKSLSITCLGIILWKVIPLNLFC